ncbi:MAG: insulinase family protein [Rhodothermales bacterium]|nr:insulinase family protein [Rhodothermales bacterium]
MLRSVPLLLALLATACATPAPTAEAPARGAPGADAPLPLDPAVRTDTLPNGLVYYVRAHDEPKHRAELRLAVDAGSLLEDADQRGLAHFVEHMLFNGTARFEEQALVDFLERTGMRFGPDVNAYTSFDETVYQLEVPTDTAGVLTTALDVLEDWAAAATLDAAEIDKERGVVIEEWRAGRGAAGRLRDALLPVLLEGSRYADRLPIGDTLTLRTAPPEALRRFYRDWYRPDQMAVVAVGHFDAEIVEAMIRARFAPLENPPAPRERPAFGIPGHPSTRYAVLTDPEYPLTQVQVLFQRPAVPARTEADFRARLVSALFRGMLNKRFAERARTGEAPFLTAAVSEGGFVRAADYTGLVANVSEDSVARALGALVVEAERVRRHGFLETELDRQRVILQRAYERAFNDRANTRSAAFAAAYVRHFLEEYPAPGIAYEHALAQRLLPTITVEEVNARAADLLAEDDRLVLVMMPEKAGLTPPTEAALAAVLNGLADRPLAPYVDAVSDEPLLPDVPAPAAVVAERAIPALGVTEITLENGVRVVMKPTDFKEEEVRFTAFSPGGTSLVSDADYLAATVAEALVVKSGVGAFDRTALAKKLAGRIASVIPSIGETEEGLRGTAAPTDLETLFQLIHLYVTAPRVDSAAVRAFRNEQGTFLRNREATPASAFQDSLIAALYGTHLRRRVPTAAEIEAVDGAHALALYRQRFADAGDFTFVFVGNFAPDSLRMLARTYLGTLPAQGRAEAPRAVGPAPPEGVVRKTAYRGQEPQSRVGLVFHGPFAYDARHRHRLRSLEAVLNLRLRDELREERAGVYSASVQSSATDRPTPRYELSVFFGADPARVDELREAVFAEIEQIQGGEGLEEAVAKVQEQQRRERQTLLEQNGFWLGALAFYYRTPGEDPEDLLAYDALIDGLTPEAVAEAARRYLDRARYVEVVLYPEAAGR